MSTFKPIPAGWDLWFHGSPAPFDSFDDARLAQSHDCNSGLGHFLAATLSCALGYAQSFSVDGKDACVLLVAAPQEGSYFASTPEFWCDDPHDDEWEAESCRESRHSAPPRGALTRQRLMQAGYQSLLIDDVEGEGAVLAVFESRSTQVLGCLTLEEAESLEEWLRDSAAPSDPTQRLAEMSGFLRESREAGRFAANP